jgi:hypothetical protein
MIKIINIKKLKPVVDYRRSGRSRRVSCGFYSQMQFIYPIARCSGQLYKKAKPCVSDKFGFNPVTAR